MLLLASLVLSVATVVVARGRLSELAKVEIHRGWALLGALAVQILILEVFHTGPPRALAVIHAASYLLVGYFLFANRHIPALWLIGLGGTLNFVAITANAGVMPATSSAVATAGLAEVQGQFANSQAMVNAKLAFLGDTFAVPSSWPLHNVFSIGDVCLALGAFIALHKICGSRLIPTNRSEFRELAQHRNFMRLWMAQAVSNLGDWTYALAVAVTLAQRSGSSRALSFLLMAQVGPAVVAGIVGGPLIDRFPRKALMIISDVLRALGLLSLLFAEPSALHLYLVAGCLGTFEAVFQPSMQASVPNLVPKGQIVAANALVAATFHLAVMSGPILGGVLVAQLGLEAALTLDAATFIVSGILVASVHIPRQAYERPDTSPVKDLVEGIRYSLHTRLVRGVLLVTGLVMFAAAVKAPLEPLFVLDSLGEEVGAVGLTGAAWGLGMLLGSVAAPAAARAWAREQLLAFSVGLVGLAVLVASQARSLSTVLFLWLLSGIGNAIGSISYESLLQERTPDAYRGRVMAGSDVVLNVAYLAGVSAAGWLGESAGVRMTYAISAFLFLLTVPVVRALLIDRRMTAGARVTEGSATEGAGVTHNA